MDPVHGGGPWTSGPCFVLLCYVQIIARGDSSVHCCKTNAGLIAITEQHILNSLTVCLRYASCGLRHHGRIDRALKLC